MTGLIGITSKIFAEFLHRNISFTAVALAIIFGRLLLKKFPKRYSYALWSCLGIRSLFDIGLRIKLPKHSTVQTGSNLGNTINSAVTAGQQYISEIVEIGNIDTAKPVKTALTAKEILPTALFIIWVTGILLMITYGIFNYIKVRKATSVSFKEESGLYRCDYIESPIAFGFSRPKVYVPSDCDVNAMRFVIEHERTHIRRGDVYFKLLAFLILSAYWVNPLAWVAFKFFNLDMELSCDESVIRKAGLEKKEEYSRWLLYYSTEERFVSLAPTAFGETDTRRRVKNIMTLKKKGIIATVAGIIITASVVAVCFILHPGETRAAEQEPIVSKAETVKETVTEPAEEIPATETTSIEESQPEEQTVPGAEGELTRTVTKDRKYYRPIAYEESGFITATPSVRQDENGESVCHMGYDIALPEGTAVHAMCDGVVESAGYEWQPGNFMIIRIDDVTTYHYYHLKDLSVKEGDTVKAGDVVATSGNTGASTGPHLHVEIRKYYDGSDKNLFFDNDSIAAGLFSKGDTNVEYVTESDLFSE